LLQAWRQLARFEALIYDGETLRLPDDAASATVVGRWARVPDAAALRAAEASLASVNQTGGEPLSYVVVDALSGGSSGGGNGGNNDDKSSSSWRIIPAENLVAFAQQQPWWRRSSTRLIATASTAADAAALLGSLEAGTDGVVLVTDDPREVRAACSAIESRERAASPPLLLQQREGGPEHHHHPVYDAATVTRVEPLPGLADRACVDLACAFQPGEGLLVGCFARALFLVHSERDETSYINARPFRVNAGPLSMYVLAAGGGGNSGGGGRTSYLSELRCGQMVAVAGADGRLAREAAVARVKVEARPVLLVEAETEDGEKHAVLLQNAETVKLVGPRDKGGEEAEWRAVSVAQLALGDKVWVLRQPAARHTGLAVDEGVSER
jgi:3-dehydroquinate synthase class II